MFGLGNKSSEFWISEISLIFYGCLFLWFVIGYLLIFIILEIILTQNKKSGYILTVNEAHFIFLNQRIVENVLCT